MLTRSDGSLLRSTFHFCAFVCLHCRRAEGNQARHFQPPLWAPGGEVPGRRRAGSAHPATRRQVWQEHHETLTAFENGGDRKDGRTTWKRVKKGRGWEKQRKARYFYEQFASRTEKKHTQGKWDVYGKWPEVNGESKDLKCPIGKEWKFANLELGLSALYSQSQVRQECKMNTVAVSWCEVAWSKVSEGQLDRLCVDSSLLIKSNSCMEEKMGVRNRLWGAKNPRMVTRHHKGTERCSTNEWPTSLASRHHWISSLEERGRPSE